MKPLKLTVSMTAELESGLEDAAGVFHRFIQRRLVEGFLLDVADYRHVPNGPGMMLVGVDVDYNLTASSLSVTLKRSGLDIADAFKTATRYLLGAAEQIGVDGAIPLHLKSDTLNVTVADRQLGAASEIQVAVIEELEPVAAELFGAGTKLSALQADDARSLPVVSIAPESIDGALEKLGGNQAERQSPWDISVRELVKLQETGADFTLIDVREPNEFETVNISGTLIPLNDLESRIGELDPASHIVVHCRAGFRGAEAVTKLRDAGFSNAWNLNGGIMAWVDHIDPTLPRY